jgi:hypothetical protein
MNCKVENLNSGRSGRSVANQFKIICDDGDHCFCFFQSYQTVIARFDNGRDLTLDPEWDYSNTTRKYLYQFTGLNRKEILAGIDNGSIKVEDLNK